MSATSCHRHLHPAAILGAVASVGLAFGTAHAATVSAALYTNDFESPTSINDFATAQNGGTTSKTHVTNLPASPNDMMRLTNGGTADSRTYGAAVDFNDFGGTNPVTDFVMSGQVYITSGSTSSGAGLKWLRVGIGALATEATLQSGYFAGLQIFSGTGQTAPSTASFGIYTAGAGNQTGAPLGALGTFDTTFAFNTLYTLTLEGNIINGGNDLELIFTVADSVNSESITRTVSDWNSTGRKGQYAGFAVTNNRAAITGNYDNFSFDAVPEPTAALLGIGTVALLGLRRRRAC